MPANFVKRLTLGIFLAFQDSQMFGQSDCSFVAVFNFRPSAFGDDRGEQPIHVERVVVQSAQISVGRVAARVQNLPEIVGSGVCHNQAANVVKWLAGAGALPADFRAA
jgi:hypothetical protein